MRIDAPKRRRNSQCGSWDVASARSCRTFLLLLERGARQVIEFAKGNLLGADVEALVNTVNTVGVMGKGIALQFKQAFPDNFEAYAKACKAHEVEPGKMFIFETRRLVNPKYIINFPTKRHWKGKSRLEDIEAGLSALIGDVRRLGIKSIAVPPLGCGHGGLRWSDVRLRIEAAFAAIESVRVLVFAPGETPAAKSMPIGTEKPKMTRARALMLKLMEQYAEPGYPLTSLELQKLAYFLQAAGEPLRLRFKAHHYGPYADNLNFVLQRLEGHFIRGYGDGSRKPDTELQLEPDVIETAATFLAGDPTASERLAEVARIIGGFETPYGMELLATVHWVATHHELAPTEDSAVQAVHSWSAKKKEMFADKHIRTAWRHLAEAGALRLRGD